MGGNVVYGIDNSYSPDVEIDHDGKVKYVRDIGQGEPIRVPAHMLGRVLRQGSTRK